MRKRINRFPKAKYVFQIQTRHEIADVRNEHRSAELAFYSLLSCRSCFPPLRSKPGHPALTLGQKLQAGKFGFVPRMLLLRCSRKYFWGTRQPIGSSFYSIVQGPCAPAGTWYWKLCRNTWLAWSQVHCKAVLSQTWVLDGHQSAIKSLFIFQDLLKGLSPPQPPCSFEIWLHTVACDHWFGIMRFKLHVTKNCKQYQCISPDKWKWLLTENILKRANKV